MQENPFILGNQPTEGYETKGANTSGMTDGGKFVGTASVCSKHELANCEECREKQADSWFQQIKNDQIKKLTDVGFTEEQAEVLLDIMKAGAFSGGIF